MRLTWSVLPVKSVAGLMGDRIERNDFRKDGSSAGKPGGYVFENREFMHLR